MLYRLIALVLPALVSLHAVVSAPAAPVSDRETCCVMPERVAPPDSCCMDPAPVCPHTGKPGCTCVDMPGRAPAPEPAPVPTRVSDTLTLFLSVPDEPVAELDWDTPPARLACAESVVPPTARALTQALLGIWRT